MPYMCQASAPLLSPAPALGQGFSDVRTRLLSLGHPPSPQPAGSCCFAGSSATCSVTAPGGGSALLRALLSWAGRHLVWTISFSSKTPWETGKHGSGRGSGPGSGRSTRLLTGGAGGHCKGHCDSRRGPAGRRGSRGEVGKGRPGESCPQATASPPLGGQCTPKTQGTGLLPCAGARASRGRARQDTAENQSDSN